MSDKPNEPRVVIARVHVLKDRINVLISISTDDGPFEPIARNYVDPEKERLGELLADWDFGSASDISLEDRPSQSKGEDS